MFVIGTVRLSPFFVAGNVTMPAFISTSDHRKLISSLRWAVLQIAPSHYAIQKMFEAHQ